MVSVYSVPVEQHYEVPMNAHCQNQMPFPDMIICMGRPLKTHKHTAMQLIHLGQQEQVQCRRWVDEWMGGWMDGDATGTILDRKAETMLTYLPYFIFKQYIASHIYEVFYAL